jgi:hypothetical protein
VGFIAEEVDKVIPELVAHDSTGQIQGLDYPKFASVVVKGMQEMDKRVSQVEAEQASSTLSITYEDGIIDTITFFGGQIFKGVAHFTEVFADKVTAPTVQTDKICVGQTCITEAELKIILEKSGTASVATPQIEILTPPQNQDQNTSSSTAPTVETTESTESQNSSSPDSSGPSIESSPSSEAPAQ